MQHTIKFNLECIFVSCALIYKIHYDELNISTFATPPLLLQFAYEDLYLDFFWTYPQESCFDKT